MINLKAVRWQNLLSTGNTWTEVRLDEPGNTLIIGLNGAGKSTMLDAIFLALFDKPFRKGLKKSQLVNSITGKDCLVEVDFETKGSEYRIRRGIKPGIFEVFRDGLLVDQEASSKGQQEWFESLIGMGHKAGGQIVVLGKSNYVPFMQLKSSERRELVEEMLDIQVFSTMNSLLRDRISESKERVREAETEVRLVKERAALREKFVEERRSYIQRIIDEKKAKFEALRERGADLVEEKRNVLIELENLESLSGSPSELQKKLSQERGHISVFSARISELKDQVVFMAEHDDCPYCSQKIPHDLKNSVTTASTQRAFELAAALGAARTVEDELQKKLETLSERSKKIEEIDSALKSIVTEAKIILLEIDEYENSLKEEPENAENDLEKVLGELAEANSEARVLGLAGGLLKDGGIKARVIKQYVPIINKMINKYLAEMDFFVSFELDEEFNETIKSRYCDHFSYSNFSEGEKMRIDLSILFTWRALAALRSRASCNILILDEIMDSSLDAQGVDDFLKIVDEVSDVASVFVISHRGHQVIDKFNSVIRFEKVRNFSRVVD